MKTVITIGRQYGSKGHEIGEKLSEALGYAFYDKKLVEIAAEKSNLPDDTVKKIDEKATSSLLYSLATGSYSIRGMSGPLYYEMPLNDKLFLAQSDIIKNIAAKENSIIVGRCADYVLDDCEDIRHISIFFHAPTEHRIKRVMDVYGLDYKHAKDKVIKTDKQRKTYYSYYTNKEWGKVSNYDLCINTGIFSVDDIVNMIANYLRSSDR